jgi:glycosyltransferase involved in cell wall biosynthesis
MHILYNGMYFYPEVGGMEVHMLNLARGFKKLGHKVEVITSNSLKSDKIEFYDGILIIRTPFFGKSLLGWVVTTIFSLVVFLKRAKKASMIHGHDIASILPGVLAKIIRGKPFVLTLHSSHFIKVSNRFLFKQYLKWGIKKADYVFAASVEIKDIARALVPDKKIEALTNPVDTELFSPEKKPTIEKKEDEYLLVCPRRLVEKNGVHFLIEAMPEIVSKSEVKLVIAGDGPLRGSIEKRLKELGVEDKVVFLGSVPNEEMPGILISADLIVIPSLMEATSIAALESMSCGKAIAASRVGGLPEIIDEDVGFLMEPGDPKDIAKEVNIALKDINLLEKKGNLARKKVVENWSAKQLVNEHFKIYKNVVENK